MFPSHDLGKIGDKLEKRTLEILQSVDQRFRPTANSGATYQDNDISHPEWVVECKVKNGTQGISLNKSELLKLQKEAKKESKDWLGIVENSDGSTVAMMSLDQFATLLSEIDRLHNIIWDMKEESEGIV